MSIWTHVAAVIRIDDQTGYYYRGNRMCWNVRLDLSKRKGVNVSLLFCLFSFLIFFHFYGFF